MNKILSVIKRLDRKYALSFMTGLLFGGLGIYTTFFYSKKPNLGIDIINNANVIDIHEKIGDLEIKYKTKDILKEKKSLRIYVIKFINNGSLDLNQSYYDNRDPIGINIINGTIVNKVEIIDSNTEYLSKSIKPIEYSDNSITLTDPLLNINDYLSIKVLVLHNNNQLPIIKAKGRLLGINSLNIIDHNVSQKKSIWEQIWEGHIGIYILRFFCYIIAFVIIILIIVLPIIYISEFFSKQSRRKIVKSFKNGKKISKSIFPIIDKYINDGFVDLDVIHDLLKNTSKISKILSKGNSDVSYIRTNNKFEIYEGTFEQNIKYSCANFLIKNKFINESNNKILLNQESINDFNKFFEYVSIKIQ